MSKKTSAERQRARRAYLRKLGLKVTHIPCHPDDRAKLKAYGQKLLEKRNIIPRQKRGRPISKNIGILRKKDINN